MKRTTFLSTLAFVGAMAIASTASAGLFSSGNGNDATDTAVTEQLNKLLAQAERMTGMPGIVNFTERKMVKYLYELRDEPEYRTFTYLFVPMTGQLVKLCDSIGYGINASIQYSNPTKVIDDGDGAGNGYGYLPQAEPNGLFMPEGLDATYVMCTNPEGTEIKALYIEPAIIVSPFELDLK